MCLIALSWQSHPGHPLVVAANRDEFYGRPSLPARFWEDAPHVLGGRDLQAGGTWLGLTRHGRFAALTNIREPGRPAGRLSRGLLAAGFLNGQQSPMDYLADVARQGQDYSGFNLLVADRDTLGWYNNRDDEVTQLPPGIYGLSNASLDTPWPKVRRLTRRFRDSLQAEASADSLLALLADHEPAADAELPDTGIGLPMERLLSSCFIRSPQYGTRASTVVMISEQRARLMEQSFDHDGPSEQVDISMALEQP